LRRKRNEARDARLGTEDVLEPEEPAPPFPPLPERPVHADPVYLPRASTPPPREPSAPAPRRPDPPAPTKPPAPARPEFPRRTGLVFTDRESMRRAMVLMAIFGPPRAMDPYGR
jgi:hypothetical protein